MIEFSNMALVPIDETGNHFTLTENSGLEELLYTSDVAGNFYGYQFTSTPTLDLPPQPPLFRQVVDIAPPDFKEAAALCMLPMLATLGTKLRAYYLDKRVKVPLFQVTLEAPQASGKSFMTWLAESLLASIIYRDKEARRKEMEYDAQVRELNKKRRKLSAEEREELLGPKPQVMIRYLPGTISSTKMLILLFNARGLAPIMVSEEIDTVRKAFKRSHSDYSDLLRVCFEGGTFGQEYASVDTFSGSVKARLNTLFSGTPEAVRKFYPQEEDGLVSRVLFVTLPDQFGKPMPVWGTMSPEDIDEVKRQLERLDQVSLIGDTVQPGHLMDLGFLNDALKAWILMQQREAVLTDDRTRDTFCRRAAVVGFRAGMLAWFLYGEDDTPEHRRDTIAFAVWVADKMLMQLMLRFEIKGPHSQALGWEAVYRQLPDEFGRDELLQALKANGISTAVRQVVYNWSHLGYIQSVSDPSQTYAQRFRKLKRQV